MSEPNHELRDRDELLTRIRQTRARLEAVLAGLGEAELTAPGPDGGWSVKDHLAHLAAWDRRLLATLQGRPGYEGLGVDRALWNGGDVDALNAVIYERNRDRPLAEVLAEFRGTREEVLRALAGIGEERLRAPADPEGDDTRRVRDVVIGNTCEHDAEHIDWIGRMFPGRP